MGLGSSLGSLFVELSAGLAPYKKDLQAAGDATKNFAATVDREMSKVSQSMAKMQSATTNFVSTHSAALKGAGAAMTAMGVAIVAAATLSIKAYQNEEQIITKLTHILRNTTKATDADIASLKRQANELQKVGVVSNTVTLALQAQLATFELNTATIKKMTPAILDMVVAEKGANATTEDMIGFANGFGMAMEGNYAALTRRGFKIDENTKKIIELGTEDEKATAIVNYLSSAYGGLNAQMLATSAGGVASLKNSLGDLQSIIGSALLPVLKDIVDAIKPIVARLAEWTKANSRLTGEITKFSVVLGAVMTVVGPLLYSLPVLIGLFGNLGAALGAILTGGAIGLIVAGLTSIAVSIAGIIQANRDMVKSMVDQQKWLKDSVKGYEDLGAALQKVAGGAAVWGRVQNARGQSQKAADLMQIAFYGSNEQVKATAASLGIVGTILKTQRSALKDRAVIEQDSANKLLNIYTKQAKAMTTPKGISPMPGAAPVKKAKDSGFAEAAYKAVHTAQQNEMYDLEQLQAKYLKAGEDKIKVAEWYAAEKGKIDAKYLAQAQAVEEQIVQVGIDTAIAGITDKYAAQEALAKDNAAKDIAKFEGTEDQKARYAVAVQTGLQAELGRIATEKAEEMAVTEKRAATDLARIQKVAALSGITDRFATERQMAQNRYAEDIAAAGENEETKADYILAAEIILANKLNQIDVDEALEKVRLAKETADKINKIEVDAANQYIATLQHRKDLTAEAEIAILETKRAALEAGTDAYNIYTQEIQALTDTLGVTIEEQWTHMLENIKIKFGEWGQAAADAVSTMTDAFANGIGQMAVGLQSFGDFFQGIFNALRNMIAQVIAVMIKKWILGLIVKKAAVVSAAATEVAAASAAAAAWAIASQAMLGWIGLATGPALAAAFVALIASTTLPMLAVGTAAAEGGIFTSPTMALIGEAGPEAVIPLKDSKGLSGFDVGRGEINVNFYHYGNVESVIDYDLLKKDLAGTITEAMRAA